MAETKGLVERLRDLSAYYASRINPKYKWQIGEVGNGSAFAVFPAGTGLHTPF